MIGFLFSCIIFVVIGLFSVWWGKKAIRERRMSNSLKSTLVTGVSEISGDRAVRTGKLLVVIGIVIAALAAIVLVIGIAIAIFAALFEPAIPGQDRRDQIRNSRQRTQMEPKSSIIIPRLFSRF